MGWHTFLHFKKHALLGLVVLTKKRSKGIYSLISYNILSDGSVKWLVKSAFFYQVTAWPNLKYTIKSNS